MEFSFSNPIFGVMETNDLFQIIFEGGWEWNASITKGSEWRISHFSWNMYLKSKNNFMNDYLLTKWWVKAF